MGKVRRQGRGWIGVNSHDYGGGICIDDGRFKHHCLFTWWPAHRSSQVCIPAHSYQERASTRSSQRTHHNTTHVHTIEYMSTDTAQAQPSATIPNDSTQSTQSRSEHTEQRQSAEHARHQAQTRHRRTPVEPGERAHDTDTPRLFS